LIKQHDLLNKNYDRTKLILSVYANIGQTV